MGALTVGEVDVPPPSSSLTNAELPVDRRFGINLVPLMRLISSVC